MIKGRKEIKAWESTGVSNKENSKTIHTYNRPITIGCTEILEQWNGKLTTCFNPYTIAQNEL